MFSNRFRMVCTTINAERKEVPDHRNGTKMICCQG
jgi:hypothetical protein